MSKEKLSIRFLRWFCPTHLVEEIEGDLMQRYLKDVEKVGLRKAKYRMLWNVIRFFRPGILMRQQQANNYMWILTPSYFKFTLRMLGRHKVFSFINMVGLTIGMAVCLLITNYVLFEKKYDSFFPRSKDVVRITYTRFIDGEFQYNKAQIFPAVGETIKREIAGVEEYVRLFPMTSFVEAIFSVDGNEGDKIFTESRVYTVDSSFFRVFPIPFVQGDPLTALTGQKKIVLSSSAAKKYFPDGNALNKVIHWKGLDDFTVSGVFEDLPENSHMRFDFLVSWIKVYGDRSDWNWDGFYCYLLLEPQSNILEMERKVQEVLVAKLKSRPGLDRVGFEFALQPLEDIHLSSHLGSEMRENGNSTIVQALQVVAILILCLALVNYMNISLARIIRRAKEIGVRRFVGSSRGQLMGLFFMESFALIVFSFAAATVIIVFGKSSFDAILGVQIPFSMWDDPWVAIGSILFILLFLAMISGFYPARILSAIGTTGMKTLSGQPVLRKVLLTTQFIITIVLVTITLAIESQVEFMRGRDLGFQMDQRLVIKSLCTADAERDSSFVSRMSLFRNRITDRASVHSASVTSNIPGQENFWQGSLGRTGKTELITTFRTRVDLNFLETYGLELVSGTNFSDDNAKEVILNQTASRLLGYKSEQEALGQMLMSDYKIVGVIRDFHERSLHEPIRPSMFTTGVGYLKFITVRINSLDASATVEEIQKQWAALFPETPFEYFFLDEFFDRQYRQEQRMNEVFSFFSAVGIFIACLGLFGFTYFMTHQRTREIGIRKVLGAPVGSLIRLLSNELVKILGVSAIFSAPASYFLVNEWLSKYPQRIPFDGKLLFMAIGFVAVMAFISVSLLLARSVRANPVDALKVE